MLNMLCLALGMATCLFIYNYVTFERSYDNFHEKSQQIYRVETDTYLRQEITGKNAYSKFQTGEAVKEKFQGVEESCRLIPFSENSTAFLISIDLDNSQRTSFLEKAYYTDATLFDIFSIEISEQTNTPILAKPNTLAISEATSFKLFPALIENGTSVIGQEVQIRTTGQDKETWVIEAVYKALPQNSHIHFDVLFSLEGRDYSLNSPTQLNTYNYVLTNDHFDFETVQEALIDRVALSENSDVNLDYPSLKKISDIHMSSRVSNDPGSSANQTFILFLIVLGFLILILASTNYINSAIISSIERSKEIGVRKLIGIQSKQLITNILIESAIVNLAAGVLALCFLIFGIRVVNVFTEVGYPVVFNASVILESLLVLLSLILFGSLISGYFPARLLINLKPIEALKGKTQVVSSKQSTKGSRVMRVLLVFQLSMSVLFISAGYVVNRQLVYLKDKDSKISLMSIKGKFPGLTGANDNYAQTSNNFIYDLLENGQVESVYISNLYNGQIKMKQRIKPLHQRGGDTTRLVDHFDLYVIDYNYWDGLDDIFVAGENFDSQFGYDYNSVIVNESAMKAMRFDIADNALNKMVEPYNSPLVIKGVVKNDSINDVPKVYVTGLRFPTYIDVVFETRGSSAEQLNAAVNSATRTWGKQFRGLYFLTRKYDQQSVLEQSLVRIFFFFTILAVFIACLGIFGLSSFTALKRTKEIGIRKILGANVSQVLYILIHDFSKLMFYGCIIAAPLAAFGAEQWLMNYPVRINLQPWFVLGPIAIMSVIAVSIIISKCWKTSIQSPIESLSVE